MPRIMQARARPSSIGRAHGPHGLVEADEDRLADQEMADIELDDLRDRGDDARRVEGEAVAGMDLEPERRAVLGRRPQALELVPGRLPRRRRRRPRNRRRCGARPPARRGREPPPSPRSRARRTARRGCPRRRGAGPPARRWLCPPTMSSPPSVVRSSRFSGTRQAACGRMRRREADHLVGRRHLEIERHEELALEALDVARRGYGGGPRADAP